MLVLQLLLLGVASVEAGEKCVRTGSSPKCEGDCCGTFPANFTTNTRACQPPHDKYPFCDTSRSLSDRVGDLISRIPDDAKPHLLTARGWPQGNIRNLSDIGVPAFDWGLNCIHGTQSTCKGDICPTSFPNPNSLGASWNMTNTAVMGGYIGRETRALWLAGATETSAWSGRALIGLDCWSPNININRDPRWGRNQEVPGEDPFLTSRYGVAYTRGLQEGEDSRYLQAVVTLKHWDAYSLEDADGFTRHNFNAKVSDYMLSSTYWPAWKASVQEGKAKGVMCSYNALNGVPTCADSRLNKILRETWGYTGYITSDTDAVGDIFSQHKYTKSKAEASCLAISQGGCDMNSGGTYFESLADGVSQGLCNMSDVDKALEHTLGLRFELGLFDPIEDQPYWHMDLSKVGDAQAQADNLFMTQQTAVLLRNPALEKSVGARTNAHGGTAVLPFKKGLKVAVLGPHGNATKEMVGNYLGQLCPGPSDSGIAGDLAAGTNPSGDGGFSCVDSPLAAITSANIGGTTTYSEGCDIDGTDTSKFAAALAAAKAADVVVLGLGIVQAIEAESHDRTEIDLPAIQHEFAAAVEKLGKPTAIFLFHGGMVGLEAELKSGAAIVDMGYPGFQGGHALASVLFGDYNPGGKLPYTLYNHDYISKISMEEMDFSTAPGRSYRFYTGEPVLSFGYGLSYTTFKLSSNDTDLKGNDFSTAEFNVADRSWSREYAVTVTNVGAVHGDEVVQAYFHPPAAPSSGGLPLIKQLYGFERVSLAAGESTTVYFSVGADTLVLASPAGDTVAHPGRYGLSFTNGVDETLVGNVTLTGTEPVLVERFAAA